MVFILFAGYSTGADGNKITTCRQNFKNKNSKNFSIKTLMADEWQIE